MTDQEELRRIAKDWARENDIRRRIRRVKILIASGAAAVAIVSAAVPHVGAFISGSLGWATVFVVLRGSTDEIIREFMEEDE